jgi:hypothetical protein
MVNHPAQPRRRKRGGGDGRRSVRWRRAAGAGGWSCSTRPGSITTRVCREQGLTDGGRRGVRLHGTTACWLAGQVGQRGSVTALGAGGGQPRSPERAARLGLGNVTFEGSEPSSRRIVRPRLCRFLSATSSAPAEALAQMVCLCSGPGGVLIVQEPIDTIFADPPARLRPLRRIARLVGDASASTTA